MDKIPNHYTPSLPESGEHSSWCSEFSRTQTITGVAIAALIMMVAGGLCLHSNINAFISLPLLLGGSSILIVDLIALGCSSETSESASMYSRWQESQPKELPTLSSDEFSVCKDEFIDAYLHPEGVLQKLWITLSNDLELNATVDQKVLLVVDTYLEMLDKDSLWKNINGADKRNLVLAFKITFGLQRDNAYEIRKIDFYEEISHVVDKKDTKESQKRVKKSIQICLTEGKGSCALHALLGKKNSHGVYEVEDINEVRRKWLESEEAPKLTAMASILDYLCEKWNEGALVPSEIKTSARSKLYEEWQKDPLNQELKQRFLQDLWKGYSEYLKPERRWLAIDELIAAAEYFKIDMILVLPENARDFGGSKYFYAEDKSAPPVYVFYNGTNHYERGILCPQA